MKILLMVSVLILSSCTMYDVRRDPNGIVDVKVRSTRSFDAPDLHYRKFDGPGQGTEFDFKAASVDQNYAQMFGMMSMLQQIMMQMMKAQEIK